MNESIDILILTETKIRRGSLFVVRPSALMPGVFLSKYSTLNGKKTDGKTITDRTVISSFTDLQKDSVITKHSYLTVSKVSLENIDDDKYIIIDSILNVENIKKIISDLEEKSKRETEYMESLENSKRDISIAQEKLNDSILEISSSIDIIDSSEILGDSSPITEITLELNDTVLEVNKLELITFNIEEEIKSLANDEFNDQANEARINELMQEKVSNDKRIKELEETKDFLEFQLKDNSCKFSELNSLIVDKDYTIDQINCQLENIKSEILNLTRQSTAMTVCTRLKDLRFSKLEHEFKVYKDSMDKEIRDSFDKSIEINDLDKKLNAYHENLTNLLIKRRNLYGEDDVHTGTNLDQIQEKEQNIKSIEDELLNKYNSRMIAVKERESLLNKIVSLENDKTKTDSVEELYNIEKEMEKIHFSLHLSDVFTCKLDLEIISIIKTKSVFDNELEFFHSSINSLSDHLESKEFEYKQLESKYKRLTREKEIIQERIFKYNDEFYRVEVINEEGHNIEEDLFALQEEYETLLEESSEIHDAMTLLYNEIEEYKTKTSSDVNISIKNKIAYISQSIKDIHKERQQYISEKELILTSRSVLLETILENKEKIDSLSKSLTFLRMEFDNNSKTLFDNVKINKNLKDELDIQVNKYNEALKQIKYIEDNESYPMFHQIHLNNIADEIDAIVQKIYSYEKDILEDINIAQLNNIIDIDSIKTSLVEIKKEIENVNDTNMFSEIISFFISSGMTEEKAKELLSKISSPLTWLTKDAIGELDVLIKDIVDEIKDKTDYITETITYVDSDEYDKLTLVVKKLTDNLEQSRFQTDSVRNRLQQQIANKDFQISSLKESVGVGKVKETEQDDRLNALLNELKYLQEQNLDLEAKLEEKDQIISSLTNPVSSEAAVTNPVDSLDSPIGALDATVDAVDSPVDAVDSPIGALDATVDAVDSPIGVLDATVDAVDSPIGALDATVDAVDSPIGALDSPADAVDSPIGALDATVDDVDSPIGALDATVDDVDSPVDAVDSPIGGETMVTNDQSPISPMTQIKSYNTTKEVLNNTPASVLTFRDRFEEEYNELKEAFSEYYTSSNLEIKNFKDIIETLNNDNSDLVTFLNDLKKDNKDLVDEINSLNDSKDILESSLRKQIFLTDNFTTIAALLNVNDDQEINKKISDIIFAIQNLSNREDDNSETLIEEIARLYNSITEGNIEIDSLRTKVSVMEEDFEEFNKFKTEFNQIVNEHEVSTLAELKFLLEKSSSADKNTIKIKELENDITSLIDSLNFSKSLISILKKNDLYDIVKLEDYIIRHCDMIKELHDSSKLLEECGTDIDTQKLITQNNNLKEALFSIKNKFISSDEDDIVTIKVKMESMKQELEVKYADAKKILNDGVFNTMVKCLSKAFKTTTTEAKQQIKNDFVKSVTVIEEFLETF